MDKKQMDVQKTRPCATPACKHRPEISFTTKKFLSPCKPILQRRQLAAIRGVTGQVMICGAESKVFKKTHTSLLQ